MWRERLVAAMLRRRLVVIGLILGVSTLAALSVARLAFDSSIEVWFLDDDPEIITYRKFVDQFGADEISVVGVFADDVFSPPVLAAIDRITRAAKDVPYAYRVRSITNVEVFRSRSDGAVEISRLMRQLPSSVEQAQRLAVRAKGDSLLNGTLFSADAKGAAVIVELSPKGNSFEGKRQQVEALEKIIASERSKGLRIVLAGTPAFDVAFMRRSNADFSLMSPLAVVITIVTVFAVFRRFAAALAPLSVVALSLLWTFGLMAAVGVKMDILSPGLLALSVAVGVATTVHVLADYYRHLAAGQDQRAAVINSVAAVSVPCFFTTITTAAGFLSLTTSYLKPIRYFGWEAGIAVMFAFIVSMTLVPVILVTIKPPSAATLHREREGLLGGLLARLAEFSLRRAKPVVIVSLVLLAIGLALISRLTVGANAINYFKDNDPVAQASRELDRRLGGSTSVEFVVDAPQEGLKDPQVLQRLDSFQQWLAGRAGIVRALSIVDNYKELMRVLRGGKPSDAQLPDSRAAAAQLLLIMEGSEDFKRVVRNNYQLARISARARISEGAQFSAQMPMLLAETKARFPDDKLRVRVTGFLRLMNDMEHYLLISQIRSMSTAFFVITLMMFALLRSWRLGLFSMIPNVLPIVLGMGFMGAVGIPLDPGTVMIAGIALGLVVDDTVHFLVALRRQIQAGETLEDGIRLSFAQVGRPIVVTSVVLAAGFAVMVAASFKPNIYFGTVCALVISLALIADLLMLPAALCWFRPRLLRKAAGASGVQSRPLGER